MLISLAVRCLSCLPVVLASLVASGHAGGNVLPPEMKAALETIKTADVEQSAAYLTSDECAGRDTAQPGLEVAAAYLAQALESYGLAGAGPGESFFQEFDVPVLTFAEDDYLAVEKPQAEQDLQVFAAGLDFVPVRDSPSGEVEGEVVFCGYGIVDEGERYDDFRGVSVEGKIVLVLSHEPREDRKGRPFQGTEFTEHARIDRKAAAAEERGARAVIVFTDPLCHEDVSVLKTEHPRYGGQTGRRRGPEIGIPLVHASGEVAEAILGAGTLEEWQGELDKKLRGKPREIPGVTLRLKTTVQGGQHRVKNVVAMRRGNDPALAGQWVVLGAHYDHVGADPYGRLFRGADDNASGSSCLLECAEALAQEDIPLGRSVLFLFFAAEEKGLIGAAEYCKAPLVPLEQTVAMLNMDMVGRGRPHDIDAAGLSYSADFERLMRQALSLGKVRLRVGKEGLNLFKRSDQFEFWSRGVPVLFFTEPGSEFHGDYHQVTDTPDKLDHEKIAKLARAISVLAYLISTEEKPPQGKTGTSE